MGMKILYILRHGKSSWGGNGTRDFDRALTPRGRNRTARIGVYCAKNGFVPALAMVSTALRTRETFDNFSRGLTKGDATIPEVRFEPDLYLAASKQICAQVSSLGADTPSALIVGHNPGLHEFVMRHGVDGNATDLERASADFPTAALAVLKFEMGAWNTIHAARGRLDHLVFPKDLDQF